MPEFQLDMGGHDAAVFFYKQDRFTQGYVEAMFFADMHDPDDCELERMTVADLSAEAWASIIKDCEEFQVEQAVALAQAYSMDSSYDETRGGHDFWFTRNGHGVGYWDKGLGEAGDILSSACGWYTKYQEVNPYRGDDGKVYL